MTNFVTNAGSGGSTFASDTITAVEYPLAKSAWGAAGAVNQTSVASPLPVQSITTAAVNTTGAITTAATTVGPVTMGSYVSVTVVVSGTYAGVNFGFWASNDNTTYWPVNAVRADTSITETTTGVLTANQTRAWDVDMGGAAFFKVISSAFTSGSAAISILQNYEEGAPSVAAVAQGPAASGTAVLGNPNLVGGSDGTSVRNALVDAGGRFIVTGAAAQGAAIAGNPLLCGGTFTTTLPTATTGQATNFQTTARGEQLVAISSGATAVAVKAASTAAAFTDPSLTVSVRPGEALVGASAALADALANPTLGVQAVLGSVFNGTTWDRTRGMSTALTTGDTGAKTATGNGATQTNVGNKGASIVVNMGTVAGTTPTCVIKVQGSADAGTTWYDIPGATTASLVATGVWGITVYPGVPTVAGTTTSIAGTATCGQVLPRSWRVVWTIGGTTPSFTITNIQVIYLPN
jgi:hypothetical protein